MRNLVLAKRPPWGSWTGALLAAAAGAVVCLAPMGDPLARLGFDLPSLFRQNPPADLLLVCLDAETKTALGEPLNRPLPLAHHSRLLQRLHQDHARLVLYNILFDQRTDEEIEAAQFQTALKEGCPVVLVAAWLSWIESAVRFEKPIMPAPPLQQAAAGVGLARLKLDPDLAVRRIDPGTEQLASASWVAAALLGVPGGLAPEERIQPRWLNYYAPPETFASIKFEQAIAPDGPAPGFFRNKIVVVGASPSVGIAGEERDEFANPYSRFGGSLSSGSAVHAISLLNLVRGDWLVRWPRAIEWGVILMMGALIGWILPHRRPLAAAGVAVGAVLVTVVSGVGMHWFAHRWYAWPTLAGVQIPLALGWAVAFNAICDYRDKEILAAALSVHFSPARVKQLLKQPAWLHPGADRREVSLLFTDIQNFSKVTALLHPQDLVRLLNAYYEQALQCVHQTDGTVMDLVGDSIFALWNAPESQADHRERACRTARELQQAFRDFDARNPGPPLRTRIGLHGGMVWIGNIGSSTRFDYAALGEPVNLASRLEGLNKILGTEILATREIQRAASGILESRLVGHFAFRGIDQPVEVHQLMPPDESPDFEVRQETFAQALHDFQRREFVKAQQGFHAVLQQCPKDGPSQFYCATIEELQVTDLPAEWIGVLTVDGK